MAKIIAEDLPFERKVVSRAEALKMFEARGETYKVEIIQSIPEDQEIPLFQHGDFIDLCRGPHVARTSDIKAFKVLSFAGAYWRGDERNAQLQRIYGTAFASQGGARRITSSRLEEAKKRDHRKLGKQLDLFSFDDWSARASCSSTPRARIVRQILED